MRSSRTAAVPAVLIGIAGMGVVANALLVRAAVSGDGFASDPGYYERAIDWDAQMLARGDAQRLGVSVAVELKRLAGGDARLCARLSGPDGHTIEGASVIGAASANLCPRRRVEGTLVAMENGYCLDIDNACAGVWHVDVHARIGAATIGDAQRVELGGAP